jgi:hypothetical protein
VVQALAQPEPIQVADLRDEAPNEINEITLRAGKCGRYREATRPQDFSCKPMLASVNWRSYQIASFV